MAQACTDLSLQGHYIPDEWKWRVMFGVSFVPALAQFFSLFCLPESPRWLIARGYTREARHVLRSVRSQKEEEIEEEIDSILASLHSDKREQLTPSDERSPLTINADDIVREGQADGRVSSEALRGQSRMPLLGESQSDKSGCRAITVEKFRPLFQNRVVLHGLLLAVGLQLFQQFSGINAVLFLSQQEQLQP